MVIGVAGGLLGRRQGLLDKCFQRALGTQANLLAEAVAQHQNTAWRNGQQLGNLLVVLLQNYEHREQLLAAGNGRNSLAQAGQKLWIEQLEALAELRLATLLQHRSGERLQLLAVILVAHNIVDLLRHHILLGLGLVQLLGYRGEFGIGLPDLGSVYPLLAMQAHCNGRHRNNQQYRINTKPKALIGLFGGKNTLTSVTLGSKVRSLSNFMFAEAGITTITIPATLTEICNHAFNGCSSLSSLVFESSATPLTMGFQLGGAADHGPFFQSPLSYIKLDREIELNDSYKKYGDESDEGIFSNDHYSNDELGVTKVVLGSNVKTIHPYMFAKTRVQQLHLPETVETIGKNVIEDNEVINAIVFYDEKERPDVADGAFGAESNWLLAGLIPGNYQYYIFVPRYRGRLSSPENELYYTTDDLMNNTYWGALHRIVVDDQPKQSYLDVAGYEWYRERYYDGVTITPPTE